jgi:NADPH2:quinone reductase
MRAVIAEKHGGPEVLRVTERDAPTPGPGELLVDVAAAGVNFADIYRRESLGRYTSDLLYVPGVEGAGDRRRRR